jgi:hypothetical protein
MMRNIKPPALVWALLFCIVLVNGLMAAPSVGHAEHHSDHQTTTHSSGVCAWFCAAGEAIGSALVQLNPQLQPSERATVAPVDTPLPMASFHSRFRGPPVFSL